VLARWLGLLRDHPLGCPDFPEPFDRLAGGAVWLVADVEAWIAEHRPWQAQGADPDES